ncbi:MAG: hypothetical protein HY438_02210 [DPANN group archaeon]|nr:hypothetical protein [DPANN group archaeon]
MGISAHAFDCKPSEVWHKGFDVGKKYKVKFEALRKKLESNGIDPDFQLEDCSLHGWHILEPAIGKKILDRRNPGAVVWSSKTVREINKNANWNFEIDVVEISTYWSARWFLQLCAELNLGIYFE